MLTRSKSRLGRRAASSASGTARPSEMTKASPTSSPVTGSRAEHVGHRLPAHQRPAQIAPDRAGQPVQVPHDRGPVEPQLLLQLRDLLRGRLRPEQLLRRAARDQVEHHEREDADAEHDRHRRQQAPADQPQGR